MVRSMKNPKFFRTDKETMEKFSFNYEHQSEINSFNSSIYEEGARVKEFDNIDDIINQCKKAINVYEDARRFCYSKGPAGEMYFDDMWEHCHNSKNECFSYIQSIKDYLKDLEDNYSVRKIALEKKRKKQKEKQQT